MAARDGSLAVLRLLAAQDRRVSRSRSAAISAKEIAIAAGLDHASGDAVVIMDADLQHPPETILRFLEKWREGYLNVYGQRSDRDGETPLKRNFAKASTGSSRASAD